MGVGRGGRPDRRARAPPHGARGEGRSGAGGALFFGDTPPLDALLGRAPVFSGLWPALLGTLALVALASSLAIPVGVAAGVYLAAWAPRRLRAPLEVAIDLLAGVPSVVMGLFGFGLMLLLRRTVAPAAGPSLLLSGVTLALLVLPYVIRTTQTSLEAVPPALRALGPSIGLTRGQSLWHVEVPSAGRGILGGVMLAVGRAAEDTAVIMLTGAVVSAGSPSGLLGRYEALPFRLYVTASEYRDAADLQQGFGAALVLLVLTAGLLGGALALQRAMERRWNR